LRQKLRSAKENGLARLEEIIQHRNDYDLAFRREYFQRYIRYHLNGEEKKGVAVFCDLLRKHGLGTVFAPKYVK
jgi:predicted solute-binding protein